METKQTKTPFLSLILYAFFILVANLAAYDSGIATLVCIIAPPVFAYMAFKNDIFTTIFSASAAIIFNIIVSIIMEKSVFTPLSAIAVFAVLPGTVCGLAMNKKFKAFDTLMFTSASVSLLAIAFFAFCKYSLKISIFNYISEQISELLPMQLQMIKAVYPEISELLPDGASSIISLADVVIPAIIPAFAVILCIICACVIFIFSRIACRKSFIRYSVFPEGFDCIVLPRVTLLCFAASLLFAFAETNALIQAIADNMTIVFFALFMLEGLSLIEYFLKQRNLNSILRIIITAAMFLGLTIISSFIPFVNVPLVLVIMGISDCTGNFRGLECNEDKIR